MDERLVANLEEFNRRYAFPRLVPGRAEDFFREVERRWGATLPVRRGDSGTDRGDGAAPPAAERSEEHTSELQSPLHLVFRLLLEKKKKSNNGARARS